MRRSTYVDDIGDLPSRIVLVSLQYPCQISRPSNPGFIPVATLCSCFSFLFFLFFSFERRKIGGKELGQRGCDTV